MRENLDENVSLSGICSLGDGVEQPVNLAVATMQGVSSQLLPAVPRHGLDAGGSGDDELEGVHCVEMAVLELVHGDGAIAGRVVRSRAHVANDSPSTSVPARIWHDPWCLMVDAA